MPQVRVGDIAVRYVEAGGGEPLVLVHGLGGSHLDWEHQLAHFAPRYRVIAPDLRGFGDTPGGRHLPTVPRLAADLRGLLDTLGVVRCLLVGHSMGGAVVQQFALDQPARVRKLVVANSMPLFRPQTWRHYAEFGYRWLVMGLLGPARLSRIGAARMYPRPEQAAQREKAIARGARNSRYRYLAALAALGRWSVIERLGELTLPVLVVGAEHDYYTREESVQFAHALPHGRLHMVRGAHHALPSEMPEIFNTLVGRFFAAPEPASGSAAQEARRRAAQALEDAGPEPAPMPGATLGQ